jgi:hypothetical protein
MLVLLLLAPVIMWVRSYAVDEGLTLAATKPDGDEAVRFEGRILESSRGGVAFTSSTQWAGGIGRNAIQPWRFHYASGAEARPAAFETLPDLTPHNTVRFLGLRHEQWTAVYRRHVTVVPYWMLVALFGVVSARRLRRRQRPYVPPDTCKSCGADTRGGAYCPQCGASVNTA